MIIDDCLQWAHQTLIHMGFQLGSEPQLIRGVPWSTVTRLETADEYIYLKYMDPAFSIEPALVKFLRSKVTQNVPEVMAWNKDLSCFLMIDAGQPLRAILKENFREEPFLRALELCADIQIKCIPHVSTLLGLGVNDWRLKQVPSLFEKFVNREDLLLEDGLTKDELSVLQQLFPAMTQLCESLLAFNIPETIEHCDFHDNNILVKDDQLTINDWGDACISHPFFSCVSMLESAKRNHGISDSFYATARDHYLSHWRNYGYLDQLQQAFDIAKTIRYFLFALSFSRIKYCPGIESYPEFNGYIAGAMRDMMRAIR
jgi:aminoglycoside/choline kinase family phosphotransferase